MTAKELTLAITPTLGLRLVRQANVNQASIVQKVQARQDKFRVRWEPLDLFIKEANQKTAQFVLLGATVLLKGCLSLQSVQGDFTVRSVLNIQSHALREHTDQLKALLTHKHAPNVHLDIIVARET